MNQFTTQTRRLGSLGAAAVTACISAIELIGTG
jgi:hypothetical protein